MAIKKGRGTRNKHNYPQRLPVYGKKKMQTLLGDGLWLADWQSYHHFIRNTCDVKKHADKLTEIQPMLTTCYLM